MTLPKLAGADSDDPAQGLQAVVVLRRMTDRLEAIRGSRPGPRLDLATDRRCSRRVTPGGPQETREVGVFERFTREARLVVTHAVEEAERGDSRVGTEHLSDRSGSLARSSRSASGRRNHSIRARPYGSGRSSRSGWIRH